MMVMFSGGGDTSIQSPFMVVNNRERLYSMCVVEDNVPGVVYRTGSDGWMDNFVLLF